MVHNVSENLNMTHSYNMTTMSVSMTSSDVSMNPTPSSVNMSYTASVNATAMNYNSSVWPTPSSSISEPAYCPNESCWWEVECWTCKWKSYYVNTFFSVPNSSLLPGRGGGRGERGGERGGGEYSRQFRIGVCREVS